MKERIEITANITKFMRTCLEYQRNSLSARASEPKYVISERGHALLMQEIDLMYAYRKVQLDEMDIRKLDQSRAAIMSVFDRLRHTIEPLPPELIDTIARSFARIYKKSQRTISPTSESTTSSAVLSTSDLLVQDVSESLPIPRGHISPPGVRAVSDGESSPLRAFPVRSAADHEPRARATSPFTRPLFWDSRERPSTRARPTTVEVIDASGKFNPT